MNEVKIIKNSDENIEVVSARVNNDEDGCWLVGEVKNVSAVRLDYIGVVVAIKDKEGRMIDSVLVYILGDSSLETGEIGYFKYVVSVTVKKLVGATLIITPFSQVA
jgi:hypothetical protein